MAKYMLNIIKEVDFDYWVIFIAGVIISAGVSAFISNKFSKKREKMLLKLKIELNIAEELFKLIKTPQIHWLNFDIKNFSINGISLFNGIFLASIYLTIVIIS